MRRIKKFVPVATPETVYKGLVQPYIVYVLFFFVGHLRRIIEM